MRELQISNFRAFTAILRQWPPVPVYTFRLENCNHVTSVLQNQCKISENLVKIKLTQGCCGL